jgi:hypothetical protein
MKPLGMTCSSRFKGIAMATHRLSKEHVLSITQRFLVLAAHLNEAQSAERIKPALEQYRLGLFRLVVVGEIKKGKSSFINALLGEPDLLPTMSDVATSTVYKILYGKEKKYKVFFLPQDIEHPEASTPPPLEITPEQVADYGTENGNPDNKRQVDFIGVQLPHPLLKTGVVIIDTPGLGGVFREHILPGAISRMLMPSFLSWIPWRPWPAGQRWSTWANCAR